MQNLCQDTTKLFWCLIVTQDIKKMLFCCFCALIFLLSITYTHIVYEISNKGLYHTEQDICDTANVLNDIGPTVNHKKNGIEFNCTLVLQSRLFCTQQPFSLG